MISTFRQKIIEVIPKPVPQRKIGRNGQICPSAVKQISGSKVEVESSDHGLSDGGAAAAAASTSINHHYSHGPKESQPLSFLLCFCTSDGTSGLFQMLETCRNQASRAEAAALRSVLEKMFVLH